MTTKLSLPDLAIVSVHKAIKAEDFKESSSRLLTGSYPIDLSVRLRGGIKKGEPYEAKVAAAADPWKLLAVALSRLNKATVDSIVAGSFQVSDEEGESIKASAVAAIEKIVEGTKRVCQGKVTTTLLVEMLQ